ncbi:MAG: glycosyltransferase [Sulfuricellaceae bacterium]|nr:glycosyltransferase [Sulfuricellaceae bacterium]
MNPLITVVVPCLNHGRYLDAALQSVFEQNLPVEVMVADGGSADESVAILGHWSPKLKWWRSGTDSGQAWAINEGIRQGSAPYVCWLNADDIILPGGLLQLLDELVKNAQAPAAYGKCWTLNSVGEKTMPYLTTPFWSWLLARYCFIAQPATLIRRDAWEAVGGLDEKFHMCMDYDLWWRLHRYGGKFAYVREFVAGTRAHAETKTASKRKEHYLEAMQVVKRYTGHVPLKWILLWPIMVTARAHIFAWRNKYAKTVEFNKSKTDMESKH